MNEIYILFAEGFEEVEALTPCDVLRRADFYVNLVSTTGNLQVTGSHGITVKCDMFIDDINVNDALMLILPGGMPGTLNLKNNRKVIETIREFAGNGKWIAAICAAPMILGEMRLLQNKNATCYPGYEQYLKGANVLQLPAITDGKIITGRGIGTAMAFSLEIVKQLASDEKAEELSRKMVVEEANK